MTKAIRHGVFETNSSSTHAICIQYAEPTINCGYLYWGLADIETSTWELQDRLNYIHTAMAKCLSKSEYTQTRDNIMKMFPSIKMEWAKPEWRIDGYSIEDTAYGINNYDVGVLFNVVLPDKDLLTRFLFGNKSKVLVEWDGGSEQMAEKEYGENFSEEVLVL